MTQTQQNQPQPPPPVDVEEEAMPSVSYPDPMAQFNILSQNYLRMLATPAPEPEASSFTCMMPPPPPLPQPQSQQQQQQHFNLDTLLSEIIKDSPTLSAMADEFPPVSATPSSFAFFPDTSYDFHTSPLIPSDYDPTSPLLDLERTPSMNTSPQMADDDLFNFPSYGDMPVQDNGTNFNMPMYSFTPGLEDDSSPLMQDDTPPLRTPANAVGCYISSPIVVDSTSPSLPSISPSQSRPIKPMPTRTSGTKKPNGTRKNVTPDSLLSLDAPTQSRKYTLPSSTSRKEVPVLFARKGVDPNIPSSSSAQPTTTNKVPHTPAPVAQIAVDEDDEDYLAPLPSTATQAEQIQWKRRQNTIAARKSRKRKLEHQQFLEGEVERLQREADVWRVRAVTLRGVLRGRGDGEGFEEWDDE